MPRLRLQVRRAPALVEQMRRLEILALALKAGSPAARKRLVDIRRFEAPMPGTPFAGAKIPRSKIPKHYGAFGLTNLFQNELPTGGHMMHTVMEVDFEQAIVELETLTRTQYAKRFSLPVEPLVAA